MKRMRYVYHIVYLDENGLYGTCALRRLRKLDRPDEIKSAMQVISDQFCNGKEVMITNFILLNSRGIE